MTTVSIALFLICLSAPGLEEKGPPMIQRTENTLSRPATAESPSATIEDVAWIAGDWHAAALGGQAEEVWSPPNGGAMMGMFRLIKEDRIGLYELLSIAEEEGSLVCRLKHFNPDLTGWEEKDEAVTFPLVKLDPGAAYFDGMTFRKVDEGLHVFVASHRKDGAWDELAFRYEPRPAAEK